MRATLVLLESATKTHRHTLRILALPLARQPALTYYHAQRIQVPGEPAPKQGYVNWATDKLANAWTTFGKAPDGNWRYRLYMFGEKMMDRIEFEEWSLKALDVEFAPKPWKREGRPAIEENTPLLEEKSAVPLLYPPSLLNGSQLVSTLQSHLEHRVAHHRKYMYYCLVGLPLTLPFALVPIVPNLPGFYVAWRAWSHWRAYRSSSYLSDLLSHHQLVPTSDATLDKFYTSSIERATAPAPTPESEKEAPLHSSLVLSSAKIPSIVTEFGLGEQARSELNRAVEQASARLRKAVQAAKEGASEKQ